MAARDADLAERLGYRVVRFLYDAELPPDLDVVLLAGPFGSMAPIGRQLVACPEAERPAFVWWLTEQLANPRVPEPVHYCVGALRSWIERAAYHQDGKGRWVLHPHLRPLVRRAHRFRYYGDLHWLQREGVLSVLVMGSRWKAEFLRDRGFSPMRIPSPAHYPGWGADLGLERDIPVLWIGKAATARRRRLLQCLRRDLRARGVEMLMIDGEEHPYVYGEERTILLNRTKVVVNVLRTSWDNHAMRYGLAAQNRALVVTEPTLDHTSFEPGVHLVQVPIREMAETIRYYLDHEDERRQIVDHAYELMHQVSRQELLAQVLERALTSRPSG